jgi:(R,R)-butanediol dehydrogenase/meso-butanediol dehydrogenase/diacetyl reductase
MAEYVAVPSQTLRRLPTELSYDHAALAQPLAVGIHAARRSGAQHGDKVVIIGAGAIGSFVLAGIKHLVDVDVTVVDFPGHRLERARRLGADRTIGASPDIVAEIADALGSERPDVVIEASGAPNQLLTALQAVTDGGRVLAVGIPKDKPALDVHSLVFREITLDSTLAHVCDTDLPAALEILSEGIIGVELAEHPLPLDNLGAELDRLVSGKVEGKVLINPSA